MNNLGRVRYRLLGPISLLSASGDVVRLRGAQQRCALAVLLLDPARDVGVERLIDMVWGDDPPATAGALIQVHMSRLRAALLATGLPTISRSPGGYRIDADPDSVDLWHFRSLVNRASSACPRDAEELYEEALALWHGDPLSGASSDRLCSRQVPGLVEEHDLAREGWLGARLESRGAPTALPALRHAYAERPDREHLAVLLMDALQQVGRRDDALSVYRQLRQRLVDDLGIEPAASTQAMHAAILEGDDGACGSQAAVDALVPAQLPHGPDSLPGRSAEIAQARALVHASARDAPRMIVLCGPPGYGKTSLAVHVAQRERASFPDGQLFADLGGSGQAAAPVCDVLADFLRALGVSAREVDSLTSEQRTARLRSLLADRRVLIVLDDARDAAQVRPLLPAGSGCAVLVTTRSTPSGLTSAALLELPELSSADGMTVLTRGPNRERLQADPDAANEILDACSGVPLALQIAASRLAARPKWSARDLAGLLRDERSRLDELAVDDLAVRSSIRMSYRRLDAAHARAFRLLALAGQDIDIRQATALIDVDSPNNTARMLGRLTDMHLLTSAGPERVGMHDLLRVFAHEQLVATESAEEHALAVRRLIGSYAIDLFSAIGVICPGLDLTPPCYCDGLDARAFGTRRDAIAWLDAGFRGLSHALTLATEPGIVSAQSLSDVLRALAHFADPHGRAQELERLALTVITSCLEQSDHRAQGVALTVLAGAVMRTKGHLAGVEHLREATRLLSGTGLRAEATACNNLAVACDELGLAQERFTALHRATEVYCALDDRRGQAIALVNLADHQTKMHNFTEAMETGQRAIDAADAAEVRAAAYVNTGDAARHLQQWEHAQHLLANALTLAEQEGLNEWRGEAHLALARTARDRDDVHAAKTHYGLAAEAFDDTGATQSAVDARAERDVLTTGGRIR